MADEIQKEVVEVYIPQEQAGLFAQDIAVIEAEKANPGKTIVVTHKQPEQKQEVTTEVEETEVAATTEETTDITEEVDETTEETPESTEPVADFSKFGTDVKNIDDAHALYLKEKTEKEGLSVRIQELEKKSAEASNPFANETIAKLNEAAKKNDRVGLPLLTKILTTDLDKAEPLDLLLLNVQSENPDRDMKIAKLKLEAKYSYDYDGETYPYTEQPEGFSELSQAEQNKIIVKQEIAEDNMKEDAGNAKLKLRELQNITIEAPVNQAEILKQKTEAIAPVIQGLMVDSTIPIPIDKDLSIDFTFTKAMLEPFSEVVKQELLRGEPTEATLQKAYTTMLFLAKAQNIDAIIKAATDKVRTKNHVTELEKNVNPDGTKKKVIAPKTPEPSTLEKSLAQREKEKNYV